MINRLWFLSSLLLIHKQKRITNQNKARKMKAHKIITALRANGNELKELISLSSFINQKADGEGYAEDEFVNVIYFNDLSKIEVHLGLFVPCVNGEPVKRDKVYLRTFRDAAKEVIFKGCEICQDDGISIDLHVIESKGDKRVSLGFVNGKLLYFNYIKFDQRFSIGMLQAHLGNIELR